MRITKETYRDRIKVRKVVFDSKRYDKRYVFERIARVNEYLERKVDKVERKVKGWLG